MTSDSSSRCSSMAYEFMEAANTQVLDVKSREILDSRGNPTLEVDVLLRGGAFGRASVPSGASTGTQEACELRDGVWNRYQGKGVLRAIDSVQKVLAPAIVGMNALDQVAIDHRMIELDGTPNKKALGANALLGVSLAVAKAAAAQSGLPLYRYLGGPNAKVLPVPLMNILNAGVHSDAPIDFQEFMIVPKGCTSFSEALRCGVEVFHALKSLLKAESLSTAIGDEGGFAPALHSVERALDIMSESVETAGYLLGQDVLFALDCAASEFYDEQKKIYCFKKSNGTLLSSEDIISYYQSLCKKYPIISIEDGCAESDWEGWQQLTQALGDHVQLVGDDLFVTNVAFLRKGIELGAGNSILIKVNQIGTLTETFDTIELAKEQGYAPVISHRSGETEDTTLADLAVATNAGQIKTGSVCRTDRTAKYNQLLRIEESLGSSALYGGKMHYDGCCTK